ncbi:MAG: thioredoxin domain-containing protein [Nitrososphaerota archaeon]|nr:thioredoxin domain-containing protein [Nitrososphaerota archaeon]
MPEKAPNGLAGEKSPYLLEHAYNPVKWLPWGKEALARAKNDGKPIFLSIGYSTCHWCHQLARESFEDQKTAAYINKNFIPIKVDREERPEVDAYYMTAVQAMTGGGGWPLSVFLTPDLKPFYGGTYFPPEPRFGMPSFMQVLEFVATLWKEKRDEVAANTEQVAKAVAEASSGAPGELGGSALDDGYNSLISAFDQAHGGFSTAPKFPLPVSLAFLLRYHYRTGKGMALSAVTKTLDEMMAGGIRDHVGGGFHRYSTDRVWLVPHFEKMLYDNALLAKLYAEAYQLTGKPEYADVVRETLGWITGEMKGEGGGFYSAQDADTAEGEGAYYSWTPEEVKECLGVADGETFCALYGVTRTGNFGGRSLLHLGPGKAMGVGEREAVARLRPQLYRARLKRSRPATDTKVLTSWNGLAISALAFGSRALGEPSYAVEAADAASFVLERMTSGGELLRRFAGGEAALPGTIEDYAYFVQGLLDLFEATGAPAWLAEARRLAESMARFEDVEGGGFYMTTDGVPAPLKLSYDGPVPSGNSVAALDLVRLSEITGRADYRAQAERTLKTFGKDVAGSPASHTGMLAALDLLLNGTREVVVTAYDEKGAEAMMSGIYRAFIPDKAVVLATGKTFGALSGLTSLLQGREPSKKPRAYVCKNFSCDLPADSAEDLASQLSAR